MTEIDGSSTVSESEIPDWYDASLDPLHPSSDLSESTQREATKEGGTIAEQFAKSHHGREVYHLQEDGFALADRQRDMTILQKRVYLTAKAYHSEKEREEADSSTNHSRPSTNKSKYL